MRAIKHILVLLAAAALLASCATTTTMVPTSQNPGSVGSISSKEGDNGNTRLIVKLDHLPPPAALDPSLTTYVVWARPASGGEFTNLGQVQIGQDRSARLETVTPYEDLFVVVTGEPTAMASAPSGWVVLQGEVER